MLTVQWHQYAAIDAAEQCVSGTAKHGVVDSSSPASGGAAATPVPSSVEPPHATSVNTHAIRDSLSVGMVTPLDWAYA